MAFGSVLVLGSGAREHALAVACARDAREVVLAPGPGGLAPSANIRREEVDLADLESVVALARRLAPELVVVGPEGPLCAGVVDALEAAGFTTFGPSKRAAELEASKAFIKDFATRHDIPTAAYDVATTFAEARAILERRGAPIVVKADGLCAGKGVVVAATLDEAIEAARDMLERRVFGDAGAKVVIEACLRGREVSVHAVSDGERFVVLPPARDHKRVFDGDRGPNTGGMGVICPTPDIDAALLARIEAEIIAPSIRGMNADGRPFRGVLFAGVMITEAGDPMLLEHNVRFGDPECEALMELCEGNVAGLLSSAARGDLDTQAITIAPRHAMVVILAAKGYPEKPEAGARIEGIDTAEASGAHVFQAGTKRSGDATVVGGGRVIAITTSDVSREEARRRAYAAAERITFDGKHFRRDIGETVR